MTNIPAISAPTITPPRPIRAATTFGSRPLDGEGVPAAGSASARKNEETAMWCMEKNAASMLSIKTSPETTKATFLRYAKTAIADKIDTREFIINQEAFKVFCASWYDH